MDARTAGSRKDLSVLVPTVGACVVVAALITTWATMTNRSIEVLALCVTAMAVAILNRFPMYLYPTGELQLTPELVIPTLILFGLPVVAAGAALGIATGLSARPVRSVLWDGGLVLLSLVAASVGAAMVPSHVPLAGVAKVAAAGLAYFVAQTVIATARLQSEPGMSWPRGLRFLLTATGPHVLAFIVVAAMSVWIAGTALSAIERLCVPVLAAAVTLQLYLPRILRGQEQRRVAAAVSVLAAAIDLKDPYTANHSAEVASLCRRVARGLGLNEATAHTIYLAGLLHDTGKIAVPHEILSKPGKLSAEEMKLMQEHVPAGVQIVQSIGGLVEVAKIVAASHEHVDGSGYPAGLRGERIPLGSRIIIAVDAYNAMVTDRPYRRARSPQEAIDELEARKGSQFDPLVVQAVCAALGADASEARALREPEWLTLLRRPAFALLWGGELVSFLGDQILFIALSLWVYELTGSAAALGVTLVASTAGQGLLGFLAGALADRVDRRAVIMTTDLGRALLVAAVPLLLPRSLPLGLTLLMVLSVGTVFFRSAIYALMPSVVPRNDLATANALLQTTERLAEVIGGVLGSGIVLAVGYRMAFYLDALSFLVSAACVAAMPVVWNAGLGAKRDGRILGDIADGLRFIYRTPLHRGLALLIFPGYLTLAFSALQAPMVVKTAGLSVMAYGMINSAVGAGKLTAAAGLAATGRRWASMKFCVLTFLLTAVATAGFGATTVYPVLLAAAFLFGFGNVATNVANATLSMAHTPTALLGRVIASRQVFIAVTKIAGTIAFAWLADRAGASLALVTLGLISGTGVAAIWSALTKQLPRALPDGVPDTAAS
jgi:putative nucleotidyltransferase with HDIG domain